MDSSRTKDRLFSFAVSAMLTSAVLATAPNPTVVTAAAGPQPAAILGMIEGARSAGFAGLKESPAPVAVATPASTTQTAAKKAPLSPTQLEKIRKLIASPQGHLHTIRAGVIRSLGLTDVTNTTPIASFTLTDPDVHMTYEVFLLPNGAGYVFANNDTKTIRSYRLDSDLNLIAASSEPVSTDDPTPIPLPEAKQLCEADEALWGGFVDDPSNA